MDTVAETVGVWKHGKLIISVLTFLFVVAVIADVALWYSLNKSNTAAATLNDIIANQPPAPKTDEEKTALLDRLAAAHAATVAEVESKRVKTKTPASADSPTPEYPSPTDPSVEAKVKLLDSLNKSR